MESDQMLNQILEQLKILNNTLKEVKQSSESVAKTIRNWDTYGVRSR